MTRRLLAFFLIFGFLASAAVAQEECDDATLLPPLLVTPRGEDDIVLRGSFDSVDDAAIAALEAAWKAHFQYRNDTGGEEVEFSGYIVQTSDGKYSYTEPYPGEYWQTDDRWMTAESYPPELITGHEIAGNYHIHPPTAENASGTFDGNESFSPADIEFAEASGLPTYLRTPDNWIKYDPNTDKYRYFTPEEDGSYPPYNKQDNPPLPVTGGCEARPSLMAASANGSIFGEPHLLTFDGASLDFHAAGEFIAARALDDDFVLMARLEPYLSSNSVSVLTGLALEADGQRIGIYTEAPHYRVNGKDAEELYGARLNDGVSLTGEMTISLRNGIFIVTTRRGDEIRVRQPFAQWLDAAVTLAETRRSKMRGLLGDYDGDSTNDLVTRAGRPVDLAAGSHSEFKRRLYKVWGESWRTTAAESIFDYPEGVTTERYQIRDFPGKVLSYRTVLSDPGARAAAEACRKAGVLSRMLMKRCIFDIVITGEDRFAESYKHLSAMLLGTQAAPGDGQPKFAELHIFGGFDDNSLLMYGSAAARSGQLDLTSSERSQSGSAFYPKPVLLSAGIVTEFAVSISQPGGVSDRSGKAGGNGFAFIIAGTRPEGAGSPNAGPGYSGYENFIAVEFDTFRDAHDPSSNHVSINRPVVGAQPHEDTHASLASADLQTDLSDGARHTIKIDVASDSIRVFVDNELVLTADVSLAELVRLQNGDGGWIGFTAATGEAYQSHSIHWWSFDSK